MDNQMQKIISEYISLAELIETKLGLNIEKLTSSVVRCLESGNKVILAGNGGSAAEATHIAAEFTGRFKLERRAWPAISLSTDLSAVTAISNDYGFEKIFARQVQALSKAGDMLIVLSTSGNSDNIIKAVEQAKAMDVFTVSLTGEGGGLLSGMCDIEIMVPSNNTPRIQEIHLLILHIVCELVEIRLVTNNKN